MQGQQGQLPDLRADTVAEANYALKADRAGRAPSKHSMLLSVLSSLFSRAHTIPVLLRSLPNVAAVCQSTELASCCHCRCNGCPLLPPVLGLPLLGASTHAA